MQYMFISLITLLAQFAAHAVEIPENIRINLEAAVEKAYIPNDRSPYKVGAVFETTKGTLLTGSNVKLPCGLTMCAERIALYKALITENAMTIKNIYVDNDKAESCNICGICLQAIAPFVTDKTAIFYRDSQGIYQTASFKELLPRPFIGTHKAQISGDTSQK